jgi:hypothetical protein
MNNNLPPVSHPDYEKLNAEIKFLRNEIGGLMLERDNLLYHICKNIKTEYMLKIGALEYKLYEQQCNILRLKRKIEIIQSKINLQQPVVITLIELQLDDEYKEYKQKLAEKLNEINAALELNASPLLSKENVQELKSLYAAIVKKLHPDLHPGANTETAAKFLTDAVNAYKTGDLPALKTISILISDLSAVIQTKGTLTELEEQKNIFLKRKENLLNIIEEIKNTFPYNQKDFLMDEKKVQQKTSELSLCLEEYNGVCNKLEEKIKTMLQ